MINYDAERAWFGWTILLTIALWMGIVLGVLALCGCSTIDTGKVPIITVPWESTPDTPTAPLPTQDAVDIGSIKWLGQSFDNAVIDGEITSASIDNRFTYQEYAIGVWPRKDVSGADCNAIICIGYERNGVVIGKFDWLRTSGQPIKTLENVHNGYNGHTMPPHGAKVFLLIVSVDGKHRTNIKEANWK